MTENPQSDVDCDVLIVGGGPVGLLLANLLGARGISTILIEKRHGLPTQSMAIGITPPSLEILKPLGLDAVFEGQGVTVTRAFVHEEDDIVGQLDFDRIPSEYRYILSIPQAKTVELLRSNLETFSSVTAFSGVEFRAAQQERHCVNVTLCDGDTDITWELRARYVVGCDGHRSAVRRHARFGVRETNYRQRFVMADFDDNTDLGREAHLFFTPRASVESFPLPQGRRRWIVLLPNREPDDAAAYLVERVRDLTGHDLSQCARHFVSTFGVKRMLAHQYSRGRVLLCGDAAHVMSPIGGQGMNTGFADAELLAVILEDVLKDSEIASEKLALYDRVRRKAFRVAADRAARGMWMGTRRGVLASRLRRLFIRHVLFAPWMLEHLGPYFAMLTIPFNTAAKVPLTAPPWR